MFDILLLGKTFDNMDLNKLFSMLKNTELKYSDSGTVTTIYKDK